MIYSNKAKTENIWGQKLHVHREYDDEEIYQFYCEGTIIPPPWVNASYEQPMLLEIKTEEDFVNKTLHFFKARAFYAFWENNAALYGGEFFLLPGEEIDGGIYIVYYAQVKLPGVEIYFSFVVDNR